MRKLPVGTGLALGMLAFALAMVALVAWLIFGGVAGKERGLAFQNLTDQAVLVKFDDGRTVDLAAHAQQTLPVKPAQFPQTFTVTDASGTRLYSQRFEFSDFKNYSFQIGVGAAAFALYEGAPAPATY